MAAPVSLAAAARALGFGNGQSGGRQQTVVRLLRRLEAMHGVTLLVRTGYRWAVDLERAQDLLRARPVYAGRDHGEGVEALGDAMRRLLREAADRSREAAEDVAELREELAAVRRRVGL